MFAILKAYGIPPNFLGAIKATYNYLRAKVVSPDDDTDYFKITAGVMQGDALAPFLFVIVLDYVTWILQIIFFFFQMRSNRQRSYSTELKQNAVKWVLV